LRLTSLEEFLLYKAKRFPFFGYPNLQKKRRRRERGEGGEISNYNEEKKC